MYIYIIYILYIHILYIYIIYIHIIICIYIYICTYILYCSKFHPIFAGYHRGSFQVTTHVVTPYSGRSAQGAGYDEHYLVGLTVCYGGIQENVSKLDTWQILLWFLSFVCSEAQVDSASVKFLNTSEALGQILPPPICGVKHLGCWVPRFDVWQKASQAGPNPSHRRNGSKSKIPNDRAIDGRLYIYIMGFVLHFTD